MTTDRPVEDALRATFAARAGTITDGPTWDEAVAASSLEVVAPSQPLGAAPMKQQPRPRRWRAPVLAAAAVAIVAVVTSVVIAGNSNKSPTAAPAASVAAAGESQGPVATVGTDGIITVAKGAPATVIDIYEDALCPSCAEFEQADGPQIIRQVDSGTLAVRYRMVNVLDPDSASGTYSTRAYAAMISVATHDGTSPDVFARFHAELFTAKNQPREFGTTDLSNSDLARLAAQVGASRAAQQAISDGAAISAAKSAATANLTELTKMASQSALPAGTPTVAAGNTTIDTHQTGWLTELLRPHAGRATADGPGAASTSSN